MKILYVVPYFVPAWSYGGPVKVVYDFAKELIGQGHNVTVATTDVLDSKSRNKKLRETIDDIKIIRFKNINNGVARNLNFYTPVGFKKWLKQNIQDYDIVHIHEFFTYQSLVTCKICSKAQKPYIIQPHGSLSQVCRKSRFYGIKTLAVKKFKRLIDTSSAVIALNSAEKKDILSIYPESKSKITIVPNGLNLDEFKNVRRVDLHKSYKIAKENNIIVFIGRIHYKKGLDISLEALALLKNTLNFTFIIIGPDEGEKNNLIKLAKTLKIQDHIIFTGLMSGIKKLETLKSADLSLLNSRSEGLPTTLLESAALGLPIVCSDGSNFPEVGQFEAGFVVDSKKQTAQMIKLILNDNQLRKRLSQNALKLASSFNLKNCAQTLNKTYQSLI